MSRVLRNHKRYGNVAVSGIDENKENRLADGEAGALKGLGYEEEANDLVMVSLMKKHFVFALFFP